MRFKKTLRAFRSPIKPLVWEETGAYIGGLWTKATSDTRPIDAIILTLSPEDLQFFAQGNASKGGIAVHTLETLFIADVDRDGMTQVQSYIGWNGYTFKVTGTGFATPNSDHFTYYALEYTDYGIYPQPS